VRPMATGSSDRETRTLRRLVWIAIVIVAVIDVAYVVLIRFQQPNPSDASRVLFVAAYLALMALMLGISLSDRPLIVRLRPALRAGAAAGLLVMGILAIFSIGIPIVVAGALATGASIRSLAGLRVRGVITEIAAAFLAIAVLVSGFEVTERLIICPAKGLSGGSGYGLISGGYHWTCVDGRLEFGSGFCSSSGGGIDANGHAFASNSC
jgi:hypothetical protein